MEGLLTGKAPLPALLQLLLDLRKLLIQVEEPRQQDQDKINGNRRNNKDNADPGHGAGRLLLGQAVIAAAGKSRLSLLQ